MKRADSTGEVMHNASVLDSQTTQSGCYHSS